MKQRTIGAIVILIVLISCLLISSRLFGIVMTLVGVLGFNEFFEIKYDKKKELLLVKIIGLVCFILIALNNTFYNLEVSSTVLLPILLLSIPIIFYNDNSLYSINDCLYILGIVYFLGFYR